jgi:hypothetical protein
VDPPSAEPFPDAALSSAQATYSKLYAECSDLLRDAARAARRGDLAQLIEDVAVKLSAAMVSRDIALIAKLTREKAALLQESRSFALSEEECSALPGRLQELEHRVFAFSIELAQEEECDVDTLDLVAALQSSLKQALKALAPPPAEEGTTLCMCIVSGNLTHSIILCCMLEQELPSLSKQRRKPLVQFTSTAASQSWT